MGSLDGKVAIVTGAGARIGRGHALAARSRGGGVVVNDLGGAVGGRRRGPTPAQNVVAEIVAAGGEAVVNGDDVASWDGAERLVNQAIETFGGLHVLVNNAGILRDKMCFNMDEAEWDAVIRVHLKGTSPRPALPPPTGVTAPSPASRRPVASSTRAASRACSATRPDQLRHRQGRHRVDDARHGPRARPLRRHGQRDRAPSPGRG